MSYTPAPLEWHPWYRGHDWLLDWLHGRGQHGRMHNIRIPVFNTPKVGRIRPDELYLTDVTIRDVVLTRQRCVGPAPYVGRPFVYMWPAANDSLGRWIAGEAEIRYLDELR